MTHPPDTFVNTGNEVIMLKNAGSGSTTHTITVSGTTPNGLTKTQNYTLTLSPNQGTPIAMVNLPFDRMTTLPILVPLNFPLGTTAFTKSPVRNP